MPNDENASLAIHYDSQIITGWFPRCLLIVHTALFSCRAQYMASTQLRPTSVVLTYLTKLCLWFDETTRCLRSYRIAAVGLPVSFAFHDAPRKLPLIQNPLIPPPALIRYEVISWSPELIVGSLLGQTTAGHFPPNILPPACLTMALQMLDIRPDVRVCIWMHVYVILFC